MLLRDLMWEIFQSTGQIEAYLLYCSCAEEPIDMPEFHEMIVPLQ